MDTLPLVFGPMEPKSGRRLDTQRIAFSYRAALPVVLPNFQATTVLAFA